MATRLYNSAMMMHRNVSKTLTFLCVSFQTKTARSSIDRVIYHILPGGSVG